jgi:hypothetical protein
MERAPDPPAMANGGVGSAFHERGLWLVADPAGILGLTGIYVTSPGMRSAIIDPSQTASS